MKKLITILSLFILAQPVQSQTISAAEYFFDLDPGIGLGIPITITPNDTLSFSTMISTSGLNSGFHILAIRVRYSDGVWSLYTSRTFYISMPNPGTSPNIVAGEYFFDADPGVGLGTPLSVGPTGSMVTFSPVIPQSLGEGFHFLAIRVKNQSGVWSLFEKRGFYVHSGPASMANIQAAEYFFDTDPGAGFGTFIAIGPSGAMISFNAMIPASISAGFHSLCIRIKDQTGIWSLFEKRTFYIPATPIAMAQISGAEYAWDIDPGVGNGIAFPTGPPGDMIQTTLQIPIAEDATIGQHFCLSRVKDANGIWSHFRYDTVTIAINGPADITASAAAGSCSAVVNNLTPTVINSEPFHYTLTGATTGSGSGSASGLSFNTGITTLTYTLNNYPAAFVSSTITILDTQLPLINCPANITQGSDGNTCGALVNFNLPVSDNCPGVVLSLVSGLPSGSIFPSGITHNVFRATDSSGNSATCSFTVSVADDDPPVIVCPVNLTINADPGTCQATSVSLGSIMVTDNCGVAMTSNNGLSVYPVGITNVLWTATDVNGLISTCVQTVTVIDNQNPMITCPASITVNPDPGQCSKSVTYAATATDNCGIANLIYAPASGSAFSVGTTPVTVTATDVNGRISTCTFSVTVKENVPPVITCPNNIVVNTVPGICSSNVSYSVTYSDNCPGVVLNQTSGLTSGSSFPVGITTNSFTAVDASGNSVSCTFTVTIIPSNEIPSNNIDDDCDGQIDEVSQKVGVNTITPTAMLHVELGDVLFTGPSNLPMTPADPPASGHGVRMMWYPDKAATRMGFVNDKQWDKDSIGTYSFASGYDAKAKGKFATALGYETNASGVGSIALGNFNMVTGDSAMAIGSGNYILDKKSLSLGYANFINRKNSFALGTSNGVYADSSFIFGVNNFTYQSSKKSFSIGYFNTVYDKTGIAIGNGAGSSGEYTLAISGGASGKYSVALHGSAVGESSLSMGGYAEGKYAIAGPYSTWAKGFSSFTAGYFNDTLVTTQNAVTGTTPLFIVGNGSNQPNGLSNALVILKNGKMGIGNILPQYHLHVVSDDAGSGGWSQGIVVENFAPPASAGEAAIAFRNSLLPTGKVWVKGINQLNPGLTFSYGTSLAASFSKMILDTLGHLGVGVYTPTFRCQVNNSNSGGGGAFQGLLIQNTASTSDPGEAAMSFRNNHLNGGKYLIMGLGQTTKLKFNYGTTFSTSAEKMILDTLGRIGLQTSSPAFLLEVNGTAGKPGGGNWSASSDIRLKKQIQPYNDGLSIVQHIDPVEYHYNELSGYNGEMQHVGVIAQELNTIAPYMVHEQENSIYLSVDPSPITYMLINTIQEQQQQIEKLKNKIGMIKSLLQKQNAK